MSIPPTRPADYAPTPAEIRAACQAIQEAWDETTRLARIHGSAKRAPVVELPRYSITTSSRGLVAHSE